MKNEVIIENNDFGFTFDDIVPVYVSSAEQERYEQQIEKLKTNLDSMYKAINVLLLNLEKNPEKEIITWPNRKEEIQRFRLKLIQLLET